MTTSIDTGVRETAVYNLAPGIVARGQNFFVQWLQGDGTVFDAHSAHEMLLLLPENGAEVTAAWLTWHSANRPGARRAIWRSPSQGLRTTRQAHRR